MAVSAFDIKAFGALDAAQLKYMAQQAEVVERYDDMCRFMHQFVSQTVPTGDSHKQAVKGGNPNLTVDERNLLSIAYKNVIGARRASWRTLQPEEKEASNKELAALTAQYRAKVENELEAICKEVLELLQTRLLNVDVTLTKDGEPIVPDVDKDWESKVFYLKMTADYYRYLAEFKDSEETPVDQRYGPKARDFYQEALNIASKKLKSTHPIRLGLALNYSVCHYEILHNPDEACLLAKTSFEQAIKELDVLSEKEYKDSTLIMQLLRDNLTLWTSEKQQQNESG